MRLLRLARSQPNACRAKWLVRVGSKVKKCPWNVGASTDVPKYPCTFHIRSHMAGKKCGSLLIAFLMARASDF